MYTYICIYGRIIESKCLIKGKGAYRVNGMF